MSSLNIANISPSPSFLADSDGKRHILTIKDPYELEKTAREICVTMGSRALVALYIMEAFIAKKAIITGSLTKAISLGQDLISTQSVSGILVEKWKGRRLATGVIRAIDYRVESGFLKGSIDVHCENGSIIILRFINEFLAIEQDGKLLASTPDILTLIEESTGRPVSTSETKWGLSVEIMMLPSPPLWKTQKGLNLVGLDHHAF